jgi:hypothetical protein
VIKRRDPIAVFEKHGGELFVLFWRDRDGSPADVFVHEEGG